MMRPVAAATGPDHTPGEGVSVPSGAKARFAANLAVIEVVRRLETEDRAATAEEQQTLAGWSGWGALPDAFSGANGWEREAAQLREILTSAELDAARATTLNAHFTDPAVVSAMWSAVESVGATDGSTFLEPGAGAGTFIGHAPDGVRMIGVELDPMTARVAHHLYPSAQIRNEGFEQTVVRPGMVDGAIGNVPFGNFTLHDPMHNGARLAIHNHFIVKSLEATRPGGLVAVVTSGWTMDGQNERARSEIARRGDLVAGVRLPTGAFSRVAGTEVNTDVLIFQKHETPVAVPRMDQLGWGRTIAHAESEDVQINEFFAEHPERIAGTATIGTGRFGPQLVVNGVTGPELGQQVQQMLTTQLEARGVQVPARTGELALRDAEARQGLFERLPEDQQPVVGKVMRTDAIDGLDVDESFVVWNGTDWTGVSVPRTRFAETEALLNVRDRVAEVLSTQASTTSTPADRQNARNKLSVSYSVYVGEYGAINRYTLSQRRPSAAAIEKAISASEREWRRGLPEWMDRTQREAETPSEEQRAEWEAAAIEDLTAVQKKQPHLTALRGDPGLGAVLGLEIFDEETQTARPSRIFTQDIITASTGQRRAETIDEAVAISMDEAQRVDVARVAELLGIDEEQARSDLAGAAYEDPATGDLVPAALYLAGPVRDKLEAAQEAAATDDRFAVNVAALEGVQPEWITIEQIDLVPGVSVLDAADYGRFARETFGVDPGFEKVGDTWKINHPPATAFSTETAFRFGTRDRKPTQLLEAVMNQKPVEIRYRDEDKKMVLDRPQTAAARDKCDQINAAFTQWVLADDQLRTRVENQWNRTFNQMVEPDFSTLGAALELPGLSEAFTPHPHQREGVARMLNSPATLLNHVVGAGKTGTMVMGAMEMRRTGRAAKPWMVVPNHLVDQVTREAAQWYPSAQILSIPTGLGPEERQMWMARSAGQDWDLVVVPQSAFKLMGVSPALAHDWVQREISELKESRSDLDDSDGSRYSIKALEAQIKTLEARAEKLLASKDVGMTFEQTGCDLLIVDEAHLYKNLARSCDVTDLNHVGSQMASDLDMKIHALREHRIDMARRDGTYQPGMIPHVVDFATGTPVANNLAELWVMQRYLRPDVLEAQGTDSLREWARAFARTGQALEMSGDGVTWRVKDRVRSFANLPELLATNRTFMSTVTREDITDAVPGGLPELVGGARQVHTRAASEQVKAYGKELKKRAERKDPTGKDNMLRIIKDGQLVALDPRMRGLEADEDGGRIAQVADQIAEIYDRTSTYEYFDDGVRDPRRGGLQLVFLDSGVPGGSTIDLYEILHDELELRGVEPYEVAFIHDAETDEERASLFERCRDGRVRVLIGSTQRMGTGVNVQRRAVALHHVDVPWRPDELEQREGRLIRQGNANREVEVHTYVTTGTIDAMSWQTIERKARFIGQITKGTVTERTLEQDDESMEQMARAVAAVAADSPLVMERVEVINEITRLQNLEASHRTEFGAARGRLRTLDHDVAQAEDNLPRLEQVQARRDPSAGIEGADGSRPTTGTEVNESVRRVLRGAGPAIAAGEEPLIARVQGIDIVASLEGNQWRLHARDARAVGFTFDPDSGNLASTNFAVRLANALDRVPEQITREGERLETVSAQAMELRAFVDADPGFAEADALRAAQLRLAEIDTELGMTDDEGLTQKVFASEMRGRIPLPSALRELREGDEIKIRGQKDLLTVVRFEGSYPVVVAEGSDVEQELNYADKFELASRARSVLNAWETECIDLAETDALLLPRDLPDGTEVIAAAEHGDEVVPSPAVIDRNARPMGSFVRFTDPSVTAARIGPGATPVIVRNHWTPEQVAARKSAETMLPASALYTGEIITAAVDESYTAQPAMAGAVVLDSRMSRVMLEDRMYTLRGWHVLADEPERITRAELTATGVDGPVAVTALRAGDRVAISDVDKTATSDRLVTVIEPAAPYNRSAETRYRDEDGAVQVGKIKPDQKVEVRDRPISALTLPERVRLAEHRGDPIPDVRVVDAAELSEHVGATFLSRTDAKLTAGVLREERVQSYGRAWTKYTLVPVGEDQGVEVSQRVGDEAVRFDGADLEDIRSAFDFTGGHDAACMHQRPAEVETAGGGTSLKSRTISPIEHEPPRAGGPALR